MNRTLSLSKSSASTLVSTPLISVIIPVYNTRETLLTSLNSVQNQTYPNLEIILVDDGSTDGGGELCDKFAQADSRIKLIHQPNRGLSAARNAGLDLASGAYLTFVDSDDAIAPELISDLYEILVEHDVKLSACAFQETTDFKLSVFTNADDRDKILSRAEIYSRDEALIHLLREDIPFTACAKLYARELFYPEQNQRQNPDSSQGQKPALNRSQSQNLASDQPQSTFSAPIRFPVGKLYEDVGTTYRLILECDQIVYLPQPYYYYYQNPNSIIHQTFRPAKLDLITLTDEMCDNIAKKIHPLSENLAASLRLRRCHARFSILRQLVLAKPQTTELKSLEQEMVTYLKSHKSDILNNPVSTRRDRFAMRSLLLGLPAFTLAWKLYSRHKI